MNITLFDTLNNIEHAAGCKAQVNRYAQDKGTRYFEENAYYEMLERYEGHITAYEQALNILDEDLLAQYGPLMENMVAAAATGNTDLVKGMRLGAGLGPTIDEFRMDVIFAGMAAAAGLEGEELTLAFNKGMAEEEARIAADVGAPALAAA